MPIPDLYGLIQPGGLADQQLGVEAPQLQPDLPGLPPESAGQSFLASLAGLQGVQGPNPRSFGEGLVSGLTQGLGSAGARALAQRQRLEAIQQQQQVMRNQANLEATKAYRDQRFQASQKALDRVANQEKLKPSENRELIDMSPEEFASLRARYSALHPKDPSAEPLVEVQQPDGSVVYLPRSKAAGATVPPKSSAAPKPSTGEQKQSLAFYQRANDALNILTNPDSSGSSLESRIAALSPAVNAFGQQAPNFLKGQDRQLYEQAQKAFTQAKLRKESGAAISQAEYDQDAKTYFAQPGDTQAVIAQKQAARKAVLDGLKFQAGPAYEEFYGTPAQAPAAATTPGSAASRSRPPLASFMRPD